MNTRNGCFKLVVCVTLLALLGSDFALGLSPALGQAPGGYPIPGMPGAGAQANGGANSPAMLINPYSAWPVPPFGLGVENVPGRYPQGQAPAPLPSQPQFIQPSPVAIANACLSNTNPPDSVLFPRSRVPGGERPNPTPPITQVAANQGAPSQTTQPRAEEPRRKNGSSQNKEGESGAEEMSRIEAAFNLDGFQEVAEMLPPQQTGAVSSRGNGQPGGLGPFGGPLRQYGYSTFSTNVSTFAPIDDVPVGPDYVLGPGDDLTINVWGTVDSTLYRTVDRNGQIILPKVGDLPLWGLTFAQADRLIREQLSRYFRGFQASVTMGRLRSIRVHVVGEVCQPGVYTLSGLATVTHALFSAGGPTKLGSLREVRLLRNHHQVGTLDLYDFLLRGDRTRDFRLESGDTVFIPMIGAVAAVAGEVKRPAIYELRDDISVSSLIEMAGGVTPVSYLKRVQIIRSQPGADRITIDVDLSSSSLNGHGSGSVRVNSGDLVIVHRTDSRVYNVVKVEGAVKYPGVYEVKPAMRITQLLSGEMLLPEANAERVEVFRRRPDLSFEVVPVDLKRAWQGEEQQDLMLRPLDQITVRTELRPIRTVTLTGQVVRPGKYPIADGERISSVLERAGGFTEKAYLKGAVFTRVALRKMEQQRLDEFVKVQEQKILAQASTIVVGLEKEEAASPAQTVQAQRELLRAIASRVAVGRMVVKLDDPAKLTGGEHDVVLVDSDALDIPEPPSSVLVLGSVRNSTSVLFQKNANLDYYIGRAGGLTQEADRKEIHIVKADGSAVTGFANIRTADPGDTIVVPPKREEKIRTLPTLRDLLQSVSSTLLSLVALAVLF